MAYQSSGNGCGIFLGLLIIGAILYFTITFTWPVILWLGAALIILMVCQIYVSLSAARAKHEKDITAQRFVRLAVKGLRDAAACISVGLGFVALTQLLLRTVFSFTSSETVMSWEQALLKYRDFVQRLMGLSLLLKLLLIFMVLTLIFSQMQLMTKFSKVRTWAGRILLVLVTITSFTFFSVEGVRAYRAEWSSERIKREAMALGELRTAQRRLIAAAYVEDQIKQLPREAKEDLKKLLSKPPSPPRSSPFNLPRSNPDIPDGTPQSNNSPGAIEIIEAGKQIGYDYEKLTAFFPESPSPSTPDVGDRSLDSASNTEIEQKIRKVEERLKSENASPPTLEDLEACEAETIRAKGLSEQAKTGIAEALKGSLGELLQGDKEYLLKPFVDSMIDTVAEVAVDWAYPKVIDNFSRAREWIANKKQQVASVFDNRKWLQRLHSLVNPAVPIKSSNEPAYKEPTVSEEVKSDMAVVTNTEQANLRESPSARAEIVTEVGEGQRLELLSRKHIGPWYKVRVKETGEEGWIHGNYITTSEVNDTSTLPRNDTTVTCHRTCTIIDGIKTCGPWTGPPGCEGLNGIP